MWYEQFTFWETNPGRPQPVAKDYFARPFSEPEFADFPAIDSLYPQGKTAAAFPVPVQLRLPAEYEELLAYSDGGVILNGEREFSYFVPEDIRDYYISYGFPIWAPALLPIGLNGGGVFYAYSFQQPGAPTIVAVAAGDIGYEGAVELGKNLAEVLRADTDISDELYR
ncbi:MAG TPA: hypothetical protein VF629_04000 [Hymenobacter sp.]|jgi:hypothetical protein|uniref:hypothetical protein n=1 Tax=Hymenobacter sp. TaxID=1898978 RepID=UPI002EDB15F9